MPVFKLKYRYFPDSCFSQKRLEALQAAESLNFAVGGFDWVVKELEIKFSNSIREVLQTGFFDKKCLNIKSSKVHEYVERCN